MTQWIDISVPLHDGMVHWPGDSAVQIKRIRDMAQGEVCNVSFLSMSAHTGTHMDAPLHFIRDGKSLDRLPLEATIGPARVIEIADPESIKAEELRPCKIKQGERILFKTRNSKKSWKKAGFDEDFVYISQEAARYLAERRIRTVGIDYLSVGGFKRDGVETHHALLGAGIWIIEGLNLSQVRPGRYELVCLPLKVLGLEGAPARAVLKGRSHFCASTP
jgi:arylformamidase